MANFAKDLAKNISANWAWGHFCTDINFDIWSPFEWHHCHPKTTINILTFKLLILYNFIKMNISKSIKKTIIYHLSRLVSGWDEGFVPILDGVSFSTARKAICIRVKYRFIHINQWKVISCSKIITRIFFWTKCYFQVRLLKVKLAVTWQIWTSGFFWKWFISKNRL